ncbi:unnamed protein product [Microthlaspi erraticum]|uniref:SGNH hydrolase-type esterase domain-containing protein n=1 Tax=Microthlaspi erraticum TaxID=1685480 RepID=A0A6D2JLP8_9BRAS|nr:unnamed protein product [Microthlaspi erraticum]
MDFMCSSYTNGAFPAVLAFGDSILDTGNNNFRMTVTRANFLPYGRDFPYHMPTGRFGNGKVLSDLVAEGLGVKDLLPPYHNMMLKGSELPTGVCFASGGSGLDKFTASIQGVIHVQEQVTDYQNYIQKLSQQVGDAAQAKQILANAVTLISIGNNDICHHIFCNSGQEIAIQYRNIHRSAHSLESYVHPGCLPGSRQMAGNLICLPNVNYGAKIFNQKLMNLVSKLSQSHPDAKFVYIDMYNSLLAVIDNPTQYGFTTATPCCCSVMTPVPCMHSANHVFWDFAHPSEKAYKTVVPKIVSTIRSSLA